MRWIHQNKEPAADYLAKEMNLKPDHARRGWEFYTSSRRGIPTAISTSTACRIVTQIYWEQSQSKGPIPNAAKYVDQSYLREALKDLAAR